MYEFGKIVLVPFPFTDLSSTKLRPALIVSKTSEKRDLILSFISSRLGSENSYEIGFEHSDFNNSGLKVASAIRLDKLATLEKTLIRGELGELSQKTLFEIKPLFEKCFGF